VLVTNWTNFLHEFCSFSAEYFVHAAVLESTCSGGWVIAVFAVIINWVLFVNYVISFPLFTSFWWSTLLWWGLSFNSLLLHVIYKNVSFLVDVSNITEVFLFVLETSSSHSCSERKRGKAIPLQDLTGPEGSRRLRLPDFKTPGTWRWQGCQPYAPPAFTPRKYPWYSFLLEAESTHRDSIPGPSRT
jgi:hypothetical protein